jgi:hypothetical protein
LRLFATDSSSGPRLETRRPPDTLPWKQKNRAPLVPDLARVDARKGCSKGAALRDKLTRAAANLFAAVRHRSRRETDYAAANAGSVGSQGRATHRNPLAPHPISLRACTHRRARKEKASMRL